VSLLAIVSFGRITAQPVHPFASDSSVKISTWSGYLYRTIFRYSACAAVGFLYGHKGGIDTF
jgi:hypothetical protein